MKKKTQIAANKIIVKGDLIAETEYFTEADYENSVKLENGQDKKAYTIAAQVIQVNGNVKYKNLSISGTIELTKPGAKFEDTTWGKYGHFSGNLVVSKAKVTSLKEGIAYECEFFTKVPLNVFL